MKNQSLSLYTVVIILLGITMLSCSSNTKMEQGSIKNLNNLDAHVFSMSRALEKENEAIYESTKSKVDERGEKDEELELLEDMAEIRNKTNNILNSIDELRNELSESSSSNTAMTDYQQVNRIMTEGDKPKLEMLNEEIETFNELLDEHSKDLSATYIRSLDLLTLTDVPSAVANPTLAQCRQRILVTEAIIINEMNDRIGRNDFKFDGVDIFVGLEEKSGKAGEPIKAEVFLQAYSTELKSTVTWKLLNGKEEPLEFEATGNHDIEIPIPQETSLGVKKYEVALSFMGPNDLGEVIRVDTIEYRVVR